MYLVGISLAIQHIEYIADSFDVFIHQEDDNILTLPDIHAYLRESHILHEA